MKSTLKPGGNLKRGIRRMLKQRLGKAVTLLKNKPEKSDEETVHSARKELKKARAVLRLARPALAARDYRRENRTLRESGRALAPPRDATALVNTLDKLRSDGHVGIDAFKMFDRKLLARKKHSLTGLDKEKRRSKSAIQKARRELKDGLLGGLEWSDLCSSLRRTYKRGRDAYEESRRTRAAEHLHEWRKRVKDIWHQLCLIERVEPETLSALVRDMEQLGDYLGDDHDLELLTEAATDAKLVPADKRALSGLVKSRRARLQDSALELGRRLYAEKPADFARRIRKYGKDFWKS